jgi:hypothetical protein
MNPNHSVACDLSQAAPQDGVAARAAARRASLAIPRGSPCHQPWRVLVGGATGVGGGAAIELQPRGAVNGAMHDGLVVLVRWTVCYVHKWVLHSFCQAFQAS